jgi:hypothetical protein
MKFDINKIEVRDNGIWISRDELEKKFNESVKCHVKADVLLDLISLIDDE